MRFVLAIASIAGCVAADATATTEPIAWQRIDTADCQEFASPALVTTQAVIVDSDSVTFDGPSTTVRADYSALDSSCDAVSAVAGVLDGFVFCPRSIHSTLELTVSDSALGSCVETWAMTRGFR